MANVVRKAYTMPVPPGAEIVEQRGKRIARWRVRNGQLRTGEVLQAADGSLRVRGRSPVYTARFRNADGVVVEVSTGCRDETAARAWLARYQRQEELVRAGVLTETEGETAAHAETALARHLDAYEKHLHAKGGDPRRIGMVRARLERIVSECGFVRLNKMTGEALEEWLLKQTDDRMAAATRNGYRETAVAFGNWCRRTRRLTANPFIDVPRADQKSDRRHQRRALTELEIARLLKVARLRPLAEYGREVVQRPEDERKGRQTWQRAALTFDELDAAVERARGALKENPALIAELDCLGRERELIYRVLVLTGLRKGELASITVGQVDLAAHMPYVVLDAADEKNRQGSTIPLRQDLACELEAWIGERLARLQAECLRLGDPLPARLPADEPLFRVPSGLTRILDRDLAAAGIPKRDERGRVVDVHAMRVTFGTHLCAAGVPLRTAQAAMRHSKPELTANIYTDPKLLDVAGAIAALPAFASAATTKTTPATRRRTPRPTSLAATPTTAAG